ncbi:MAG TPA: hypothetical protein VM260_24660 [Pirellula sp.]|nr:hypothetical protein [Pirellula sp.]
MKTESEWQLISCYCFFVAKGREQCVLIALVFTRFPAGDRSNETIHRGGGPRLYLAVCMLNSGHARTATCKVPLQFLNLARQVSCHRRGEFSLYSQDKVSIVSMSSSVVLDQPG